MPEDFIGKRSAVKRSLTKNVPTTIRPGLSDQNSEADQRQKLAWKTKLLPVSCH